MVLEYYIIPCGFPTLWPYLCKEFIFSQAYSSYVRLNMPCVWGWKHESPPVSMAEPEWMIQWGWPRSGPPHFSWHSVGQNLIMCTHLMAKEAGKVILALHLGRRENNCQHLDLCQQCGIDKISISTRENKINVCLWR